MLTLNKQIWINQLMEKFYPEPSFLNYVRDFSNLTDNDKINLAEAGTDPKVLINNTTYPIITQKRTDNPLEITLEKFETENTLVRRPEVIQYSYDQLESVLMGHRNILISGTGRRAAHAYAPQVDTPSTPVILTTGANNGEGKKRLTLEDVLKLKRKYDLMDIPYDKRYLVLCPQHVEDLIILDTKSFKDITDFKEGLPQRFAGFNMLTFTANPVYNKLTLQKVAFGAVAASTDTFSSFSFYSDEVMKADGNIYMYIRLDDPELRGTIVGFDKRFVALPIRNKAIGAIVAADAP
jgi:hypothetical protein